MNGISPEYQLRVIEGLGCLSDEESIAVGLTSDGNPLQTIANVLGQPVDVTREITLQGLKKLKNHFYE